MDYEREEAWLDPIMFSKVLKDMEKTFSITKYYLLSMTAYESGILLEIVQPFDMRNPRKFSYERESKKIRELIS